MVNEIRIATSITPVNVNTADADDDGSVESKSIDANVGRSFGGRYNTLEYNDDKIISYIGYILKSTYEDLAATWYEEAGTSNGSIPTTARAVAVEYTGELGTVGYVYLKLNYGVDEVEMAKLDAGEGVVIPIQAGITPANIYLKADNYSDDVNEATVNVFLIGV